MNTGGVTVTTKQAAYPAFLVYSGSRDYGYSYNQYATIEDAQSAAEEQAHRSGADVYVLKAVRKVSPKRDVVTVDL